MKLGVCDYPEHVPYARWRAYPRRMKEAGLSVVRLAEFAWARFEPRRGEFDWAWLDAALEELHAEGLEVVLGTPTAAPPAWLVEAFPEVLPVDREGRTRQFGSRRHTDYSSPVWWAEAARIVEIVARRYGAHPAVVGWQTDNEHGCHDTVRSYSPAARAGFQRWLERRYGDPAALNEAWGAEFWSQRYGSFAQVGLPHLTVTYPNPAHVLDFYRYSSEQVAAFDRMQTDLLRRHSPGRFVTHNFMAFFGDFDLYAAGAHLDFASFDNYPTGTLEISDLTEADKLAFATTGHPDLTAFSHDLLRNLVPGRGGHWVMEQQPGPINWAPHNPLPARGAVRLWTLQGCAHGAEAVVYFRWRAALQGAELFHSGLLRHDGTPDRGLGEVARLRTELAALPPEAGQPVTARVALLHDYESLWAYEVQPHGADANYGSQVLLFYRALRALGVDVDVLPTGRDLSSYPLVVAPALTLLSEAQAGQLGDYARAGGHLVLGPRTGFREPTGAAWPQGSPGPLAALAGVRAGSVASLRPGLHVRVEGLGGSWDAHASTAHTWAEDYELTAPDVRVLARYVGGPFAGGAALTERPAGPGRVSCLGAWSESLVTDLLERALEQAGVPTERLGDTRRVSRRGGVSFWQTWSDAPEVQVVPPEGYAAAVGSPGVTPEVAAKVAADAHARDAE